jgi:hypothetical protein
MLASSDLRSALRNVMQRGATIPLSDSDFNEFALSAFRHQFELNDPYRHYCERRDRIPAVITEWTEIPAVPTAAFKEVALVAGDPADARVAFKTSGTTRGAERRGTHYILDPTLYEASLLASFSSYVMHDTSTMRILSLIPSNAEQPDSSLSYMASMIVRDLGTPGSGFFADTRAGLLVDQLRAALTHSASLHIPVCLLGTALAFVHFMAAAPGAVFQLANGSRLMDTGGFKGERRVISAHDLRARYRTAFGLPPHLCVNEYGMTELCSQYYDARFEGEQTVKRGPAWLRARAVDPETLEPVARGKVGILQHFDLANLDSVCAVLTEDLAYEVDDGFVLLGRVPGATPRGCSIAMDILLSDARPN